MSGCPRAEDWVIRRARPSEAEALSELAIRSKGHWGYEPEFLEACRPELTLSAHLIETGEVHLLEVGGRIVGFYGLADRNGELEFTHFFVDPPAIGRGAGRLLWRHAVERAKSRGVRRLVIESDPYAEGFYRKLGAERIGETASPVNAGRKLPLLQFRLTDGGENSRG